MKLSVYTVYDTKAEVFMSPFFMGTDNTAKRGFADAVNNPETPFGKHPSDYSLFKIGVWSDRDGEISPTTKESLGNGVEYLNQE